MEENVQNKGYGYGKRPLWQWVVIYLVLAVIIYGAIYYFVLAKHGGYGNSSQAPASTNNQTTASQTNSESAPTSNIYLTKTDATKGNYLTDFAGTTLYTYDKDTKGISNCTGSCASNWPPYSSGATAEKTFPTNISVITRADGSKQFAWKGMPLYYFSGDTKPGQITGDGVNGFNIVKP